MDMYNISYTFLCNKEEMVDVSHVNNETLQVYFT